MPTWWHAEFKLSPDLCAFTDVHWNGLGVALGVKLTTTMKLSSWPSLIGMAYHWIAIRRYSGYSTSTKNLYYNDSAGGYGGSTGAFSNSLSLVWQVNQANTGNIVW